MAFALVASVTRQGGSSGGTSGAIDTTGANLLVISLSYWTGTPTVSDSKGNTWTALTAQSASGGSQHRFYMCRGTPTVGSGHTFTFGGSNTFPSAIIYAFSGAHTSYTFEVLRGNSSDSATSLASGKVVPKRNNSLVISGLACNVVSGVSVDDGTLTTTILDDVASSSVTGAAGYVIQTTATAVNATWSWTTASTAAGNTIVFREAAVITDAFVNTAVASNATTTGAFNLVAGNTVLVGFRWTGGSAQPVSVTDSAGNTYVRLGNDQYSWVTTKFDVWGCFNCASGGASVTVSVNVSGGTNVYIRTVQYAFGANASFVLGSHHGDNNVTNLTAPYDLVATADSQFAVVFHGVQTTGHSLTWLNETYIERGDDGSVAVADVALMTAGDNCPLYGASSFASRNLVGVLISTSTVTITEGWTHILTTSASGLASGTTPSVDTTGADFIVVGVASQSSTRTLSDSKGNTWNALTIQGFSSSHFQLFYAKNPTVGSGHTFTGTSTRVSIIVFAFSGGHLTDPFQPTNEAGQQASSGTSASYGNMGPFRNGSLFITGCMGNTSTSNHTPTVGTNTQVAASANNVAAAMSYLIQTANFPVQVDWSWTTSSTFASRGAFFFGADVPAIAVRGTQVGVEVVASGAAPMRFSAAGAEVLATADAPMRFSAAGVEVLWTPSAGLTGIWMGEGGGNVWVE